MDLKEKLKEEKQSHIDDFSKTFTAEVQQLLIGNSDADQKVLRESGLGDALFKFEATKKANYLERKALDDKHEGDIFSEEEIQNIACKYGLRFLPAKHYQGEIASFVPTKLREFFEKETVVTGADYQDEVLILAPEKCFFLKGQPKPVPVRRLDPILFYKIKKGYYKMICKWGKDLTPWNYIKSIRRRDESSYFFLTSLFFAVPLNIILALMFPTAGLWLSFISIAVGFIVQGAIQNSMESDNYRYSANTYWNQQVLKKGI